MDPTELCSTACTAMLNNKQWDGTISSQNFKLAAFYLMKAWEACCDVNIPLWRWENSKGISPDSVGGYLVLEEVAVASKRKVDDTYHVNCDIELEDAATMGEVATDCQYHLYTYHLLYSESYKVPLLFFTGYSSDGRRLDWEDIESDLPESSRHVIDKSKWTFLSQEDHPYLQKPWFLLHPCGTSELMKLILSTWLLGSSASNEEEGRRFCVMGMNIMGMNIDCGHDAKEVIMQRILGNGAGGNVRFGIESKGLIVAVLTSENAKKLGSVMPSQPTFSLMASSSQSPHAEENFNASLGFEAIQGVDKSPHNRKVLQTYLTALLAEKHLRPRRLDDLVSLVTEEMRM